MGARSPRPRVRPAETRPGLLDLLEEGFHSAFFGFFYINELLDLRLVCKAFRECLGAREAEAALRQMRGLVFPAQWPPPRTYSPQSVWSSGRMRSSAPETQLHTSASSAPPWCESSTQSESAAGRGRLPEGSTGDLFAPLVVAAERRRDFNVFRLLVSLAPPLSSLVELSLYWDQSAHPGDVLLPLFNKLLLVAESIQSLTYQSRTAAWSVPPATPTICKAFPSVKRLRVCHSFLRRAGPGDTFYGDLVFPPGAFQRREYFHPNEREQFDRTRQPRRHLLSNCVFPACEDVEYHELCENELTRGYDLVAFIRDREVRTFVHLFREMTPRARTATVTLCSFRSLPFVLKGVLDCAPRDKAVESASGALPEEEGSLPGHSLEALRVLQALPDRFADDVDAEETELEEAFPEVVGRPHRGRVEAARVRPAARVLTNLRTVRLVVQDDGMKEIFDAFILPVVRHLCTGVRVMYEGTATLPLELTGRAMGLPPPRPERSLHPSSSGLRRRMERLRRKSRPEQRVDGMARVTPEPSQNFHVDADGVSPEVVEMLRRWISEPGWMDVGLWNPIRESPPRLQFRYSAWHAEVVAVCAEALRSSRAPDPAEHEPDGSERSRESEGAACAGIASGEKRETEAGPAAEPSSSWLPPRKKLTHPFVLPTVTVKHTLWAFDGRPFDALISALPSFVLALDPYNVTPQSRLTGPFPNLLGLQVALCKWGKICLARQHISLAKAHAAQTRFLRLLDSNRLEYKSVESATKAAVNEFLGELLDACPRVEVVEYRRVSLEYTWQMETGVSGDTPPFSLENLYAKGFRVLQTRHIPFSGGDLLPSSCHSSVIIMIFVRKNGGPS
ncbi:hypothetical protein BESB_075050 [Besnoitia besnoiti]|uniref:Uncharacterized protein n=1 Tax=Besnoitia besnoiti TaxID=94643 RepID=A0A2A9MFB9_BESBE|nr:uncharacterized protein BESB_075050 [Besnoitia besnoiti]PFH34353.1 hypothetical protein BESB_075050 [Besnoitia besnoiti]